MSVCSVQDASVYIHCCHMYTTRAVGAQGFSASDVPVAIVFFSPFTFTSLFMCFDSNPRVSMRRVRVLHLSIYSPACTLANSVRVRTTVYRQSGFRRDI